MQAFSWCTQLLGILFPCSAINLRAPAQTGITGQMQLPTECRTAGISQHAATRLKHCITMQSMPHMSTPHLCAANRSIFSTGRRSVHSAGGNKINAATPSEQPKGKVISTLAIMCSHCITQHLLPRLAQNTVCFTEFWGMTIERTVVSLQAN